MALLKERYELADGRSAKIFAGKPLDASFLWDSVKDVQDQFFSDDNQVIDRATFAWWFERDVEYACVSTVEGKIVGCGYLVAVKPGESATFHAFADPEFRSPTVTIPLAKFALDHFIKQFKLKTIETVDRRDNKIAHMTSLKLGFKDLGTLSKHQEYNGRLVDCYLGILKGHL